MARGKKKFYIKAPHGQKIETVYKGAKVSVELKWSPGFESDMEIGRAHV